MLSIIKENLLRKDLISTSKPILCAVSGGIDSMVMLDCLIKLNLNIAVAHIDHNTRQGQSQKDKEFVHSKCKAHNISFHTVVFNPESKEISNFQAKARDFRYKFFNSLLDQYNYSYIVTAHHLNDDFETFIINLTRGTGLKGLTGIPFENGTIIRPLNGVSKKQIEAYAEINDIDYVDDSSNHTDNYLRNRIRHHVIPSIEKLNENAITGFESTLNHLKNTSNLLTQLVNEKYISKSKHNNITVNKKDLSKDEKGLTILHIAFSQYGFNPVQLRDILSSSLGKKISHNEWNIYNDREHFILLEEKETVHELIINETGTYTLNDGRNIKMEYVKSSGIPFEANPFPLIIRPRKDGDQFKPLGMGGKTKSIKKLISDLKLTIEEKEQILVLEKDTKIKSVLGYRDAHFSRKAKFHLTIDIQ